MANSNKHVNKKLRDEYRNAHMECELCPALRRLGAVVVHYDRDGNATGRVSVVGQRTNVATEVDHIFGGNPRHDLWSNFIASCRSCHDWKHQFSAMARVVELWIKWHKGEFNVAELDEACRQSVVAWVERQKFSGTGYTGGRAFDPTFLVRLNGLRDEILRGVGK